MTAKSKSLNTSPPVHVKTGHVKLMEMSSHNMHNIDRLIYAYYSHETFMYFDISFSS